MALTNGPNLGLLTDGEQGEAHYEELMRRWRGMDALVQPAVLDKDLTTPPGDPSDGARYIVAAGASGAWNGEDGHLARWSDKQDAWEFFVPGNGWAVFVVDEAAVYYYLAGSWRRATATPAPVVSSSDSNTDASPSNAGAYTRFDHASPTYTFDAGAGLIAGAEYHGRYVGEGTLLIVEAGGMEVHPPAGGTLEIPPGGSFTVKMVSPSEADLSGVTVPADPSA